MVNAQPRIHPEKASGIDFLEFLDLLISARWSDIVIVNKK